jgi:hypothetical protein
MVSSTFSYALAKRQNDRIDRIISDEHFINSSFLSVNVGDAVHAFERYIPRNR